MTTTAQQAFDDLCEHARETALLQSIEELLGWDERTMLPSAGGEYRAEQVTRLSGLVHQRQTDPRIGQWLESLRDSPLAADPHGDTATTIRQLQREYDKRTKLQSLWEVDVETKEERPVFNARHVPAGHPSYHPSKQHLIVTDCYGGDFGNGLALVNLKANTIGQLVAIPLGSKPEVYPDERFPFRNHGIWAPPRKYLNEPRPVWSKDGSKVFYTSEESGRLNLYVVDTSDL